MSSKKDISPRTKQGVFFGDFTKRVKESVKKINRSYPDFFTEKYAFTEENFKRRGFLDHPIYNKIRIGAVNEHHALLNSMILHAIGSKKYISVFIQDEKVLDFIKNHKMSEKDENSLRFALDDVLPELINHEYDKLIVLNIANEKNNIAFRPFIRSKEDKTFMIGVASGDNINFIYIEESDLKSANESFYDYEKMLLNALLYIAAFPECLHDGPPKDLVKNNGFRGEYKNISCSDQLKNSYNSISASPHFRRGHFRLLSSDRFSKKKGQVIFVKPSMVNGEALTVESARNE